MNALISFTSLLLIAGCAANSGLTGSPESVRHDPADGIVEIRGEVIRPANYPYTSGMKVMDLVRLAGGLTDFGSGIRVVRGGTNLVDAYHGGPKPTTKSKYMNTLLEVGDLVSISRMRY